ncbi:MAG: esterase [Flavobacteriaceae bacterium]|nr:esterase [Flavobacteriaceae bacterium]
MTNREMKLKKFIISLFFISLLFSCKEEKKQTIVKDVIVSREVEDINLSSGTLQRIDSFPSKFIKPRNVDVLLPNNYTENKKYAVLYMHDGQMLFDATKTWNKQEWKVDEIVSILLEDKKIRDIIVVAIWNIPETRHSDYFPQKAFELLSKKVQDSIFNEANNNLQVTGLNADNYLKFIVQELKPYVDKQFSALTDYQNTFIAGSSMGGLISMYAVCEYPEIFAAAVCISTHWPGIIPSDNNPVPATFFSYMEANLPSPKTHKFYFDYGTETLDQYYPQYLDVVDKIFFEKGYTEKNYMNLEFEGADHSEESWNRRFDIPLIFLLKRDLDESK